MLSVQNVFSTSFTFTWEGIEMKGELVDNEVQWLLAAILKDILRRGQVIDALLMA